MHHSRGKEDRSTGKAELRHPPDMIDEEDSSTVAVAHTGYLKDKQNLYGSAVSNWASLPSYRSSVLRRAQVSEERNAAVAYFGYSQIAFDNLVHRPETGPNSHPCSLGQIAAHMN